MQQREAGERLDHRRQRIEVAGDLDLRHGVLVALAQREEGFRNRPAPATSTG
jgi:hypothetical protein